MNRLERYLKMTVILLSGLALKGALMGMETVSFDSDEAVVALMAQHILTGERPVFFYGQAYMGSLDAFLIAAAFRLFGVSVFSVRFVQFALYGGVIVTTYQLVRHLVRDESTAQITALLTAIPPPLVSLYTTMTLGGYGETLLLGTCLLLLGQQVTHEAQGSWLHWALLGLVAGLAFWTLPLSVVYLLPVALFVLRQWRWRLGGRYGLAVVGFLLGSSPWWGYCLRQAGACLEALIDAPAGSVITSGWFPAIVHRVFSLLFLGLPALWGLRNPWSVEFTLSILAVPVLVLYLGSIVYTLRARNRGRFLPLAMGVTFVIVFLATPFGNDGTGRYLLPLYLLVALMAAGLIRALQKQSRFLAAVALAYLLVFAVGATLRARTSTPAGMTAQLDARLQFGNQYDGELISFLQEKGELHGYSHFWVAYKITFLSGEQIIIAPRLSYRADLRLDQNQDRYPAYSLWVDQSSVPPFYLTTNQTELDRRLRSALGAGQIGYSEEVIGPYHLFYGLSAGVTPEELGLHSP